MSKLISFREALSRLRFNKKPVPRTTLMNWVQRGILEDMRPPQLRGKRKPIYLDEEQVVLYAEAHGYEWVAAGNQDELDEQRLLWEEVQKLAIAVARFEQRLAAKRDTLAIRSAALPNSSTRVRSALDRALATQPTDTAYRLDHDAPTPTQPAVAFARPDLARPAHPAQDPNGHLLRWHNYNPSEAEVGYRQFWVGRGRISQEYLGVFVPCVRAHGVAKNTAGSMREGWKSRHRQGKEQRFQVTYLEGEPGQDGQMVLTHADAVQVIRQLQKEARDHAGKWDVTTLCADELCPVCPTLSWNPHPAQEGDTQNTDALVGNDESHTERDESD